MAKKSFANRVNYLVTFVVAVVFNFIFAACDSYEMERSEDISTEYRQAPKEPVKPQAQTALNFSFLRTDSTAAGKIFSTEWISSENTTGTKVGGKLSAEASHSNDGNAVLEAELNKVIDLSYARQHTTYGELRHDLTTYGGERRNRYGMRVVAQLGDGGTLCQLDAENIIAAAVVLDTLRFFPADSIEFGKIHVKSLNFVEKAAVTRAAETYVDRNDPRYVEVVWSVPVKRVHDKMSVSYMIEVSDTVVVYPIKKNDIADVKTDTLRQMVDPSIINCIVRRTLTYKNGESGKSEKSATIKCALTAKPEWSENVSNTDFSFIEAEPVKFGTPYSLGESDGVKTLEREDVFTTVQGNGVELIKNPYTFKHQSVIISDEFGTYEFGFVNPDFRQVSTKVSKVSETATLETARLFNTVEVSYLGGRQTGEETVLLKREIEEYVTFDGLEKSTAKKTTLDDKTVFQISSLTRYSTGREVRKTATLEVERKAEVGQPWSSIEANTNHQSGDYVVTILNRDQMTKTINGVKFTFVVVEKLYTSEVKLNGCTKKNSFKVIEVESCVASYGNDSYNFGEDEVKVNHTNNLTAGNESDGYKVYNYTDKVSYTFNGNVKTLTPTGTIKVKVEEPKAEDNRFASYGNVKLVRQTTALNETGNGYIYVLSVQFTSGHVISGLVQPGSTKINWLYDKVELVEGINKLNSAVYTSEGWVNCTAHDVFTADYLIWYRGTQELKRVSFDQALSLNWDRGYTREDNGKSHLTVYTNRFKLEVGNGKLYVTDTVTGSSLNVYGK
jgi:hypothetical protein